MVPKQKSIVKSGPAIIGNKTYVDLPTAGVSSVLAKIDTGADSSSIWASDISEDNGVLSFKLFDTKSNYYTGEVLTASDFSQVSVKNSFGTTQIRYKTTLNTRIGGRIVRVKYTLANRAKNSAPILIGRNTLKGKFLVDVSKKAEIRPRRVLIVSKVHSAGLAKFTKNVEQGLENATIDYVTYDDIVVTYIDGKMTATVTTHGTDLADYDIIHFKTSILRDLTASLARYAKNKGVVVIDYLTISEFPTMSKLYEYTILTLNKILIPNTIFVTPAKALVSYDYIISKLGSPFILKDVHGSKGNFNEVIRSESDYKAMLGRTLKNDIYLVAQKFTPNKGDYRILVMGARIELAIYRSRLSNDTHLNNTTQGGSATLAPLSDLPVAVRNTCLLATKVMGRDIAGVDMVEDSETEKWYCFEVNDGPQIVTGAFLEEKKAVFTSYIKRILEKRI